MFCSVTEQKVSHLALELLSLERESLGNTSAFVFTQQGSDVLEYLHQQPIAILDVPYDRTVSRVHVSIEWMPT
jgi:hypothetical protein